MNSETLRAVLEEASALTSFLPEGIRQVAFSKAFDALIDQLPARQHFRAASKRPTAKQYLGGPKRSTRSHRVGPKFALGQLIDSGYFVTRRSLPEIQSYLRDSHGHDYGSNELSISLLRLIRDARLSRERDSAGQYGYWVADGRQDGARSEGPRGRVQPRLLTEGKRR
jgi:hypothetical protein